MRVYSFFPFDNASIASGSPAGEREAIIGYKDNQEIQNKICEFLDLFNIEVDNMFNDWTEKDLQEYYNSAIGVDIKAPIKAPKDPSAEEEEVVEEIEEEEEKPSKPAKAAPKAPVEVPSKEEEEEVKLSPPASDDDVEAILKGAINTDKAATDDSLEEVDMTFDDEDEDSFFED